MRNMTLAEKAVYDYLKRQHDNAKGGASEGMTVRELNHNHKPRKVLEAIQGLIDMKLVKLRKGSYYLVARHEADTVEKLVIDRVKWWKFLTEKKVHKHL